MKSLNEQRLRELRRHLEKSGIESGLMPELLDHMACEAEERLWEGQAFEQVVQDLFDEASPHTLKHLQIEHKHMMVSEASLTDIVFENRNRLYGAYVLRRQYPSHVTMATVLGVLVFWMIFMLPALFKYFFV
ncbi:hypothetical protein [Telluribacter sp. SYSU D00476]|uniref:hypothetical protein n=1 Tax=Telluribacter sp. SYSU D00476 TaxID=2811430 RepID=UPI001FF61A29|nr:hypothetical protein [Telluribacter sp. SYSU D00476]